MHVGVVSLASVVHSLIVLRSANEENGRHVFQLEVGDVMVIDGLSKGDSEEGHARVQGVNELEKRFSRAFARDALRRIEDDDERGLGCVVERGLKGGF